MKSKKDRAVIVTTDWLPVLLPAFSSLGFEVIHYQKKASANGPDMWVKRANRAPLSVEIKTAIKKAKGLWQTEPVSKPRQGDDLVAIICHGGYVLIEPMADHLRACSRLGYRSLTLLLGGGSKADIVETKS